MDREGSMTEFLIIAYVLSTMYSFGYHFYITYKLKRMCKHICIHKHIYKYVYKNVFPNSFYKTIGGILLAMPIYNLLITIATISDKDDIIYYCALIVQKEIEEYYKITEEKSGV